MDMGIDYNAINNKCGNGHQLLMHRGHVAGYKGRNATPQCDGC